MTMYFTRTSAVAEGTRDALFQLNSCEQLLHICTQRRILKSPIGLIGSYDLESHLVSSKMTMFKHSTPKSLSLSMCMCVRPCSEIKTAGGAGWSYIITLKSVDTSLYGWPLASCGGQIKNSKIIRLVKGKELRLSAWVCMSVRLHSFNLLLVFSAVCTAISQHTDMMYIHTDIHKK